MPTSPLAQDAARLLGAWQPPDSTQDHLRAAYLDHITAHDDALLRDCRYGHITASTIIVDPVRESVLLTLHPIVGRWLQTGGHCEADDRDLIAAALREATEESGIAGLLVDPEPLRLDRHAVRCRAYDGTSTELHHLDVQFLALSPPDAQETRSAESLDLRWWPWSALPEPSDASVRALVAAARARCGA